MKMKVFTVVTLLIVNNVGYAYQEAVISKYSPTLKSKKRQRNTIQNDIVKALINRGIETDVAHKISADSVYVSKQSFNKLMKILDGVSYQELIEVLANRVLYKKNIDFSNKHTLIDIAQNLKGFNLSPTIRNSLSEIVAIKQNTIAA